MFALNLIRIQPTNYGTYLHFADGTLHYVTTVWEWRDPIRCAAAPVCRTCGDTGYTDATGATCWCLEGVERRR
jgi:hypothetical protein